jgi:hypothetical protein
MTSHILAAEPYDAVSEAWRAFIRHQDVLWELPEIDWSLPMTAKEMVQLREALREQEYFLAHDKRCSEQLAKR